MEIASFHVRPAVPSDAPTILQFIRELADYEKLTHEVSATEDQVAAAFFPSSGTPAAECLLAFVDGQPAGFAVFFPNFSTFLAKQGLFLEDLFVRPSLRGRGIGKALLREFARTAVRRGCGRAEWIVLDWNQPAISFYESFGASHLKEWNLCRLDGAALNRHA
jgi:GNAT superfamily N-acetyltransferase